MILSVIIRRNLVQSGSQLAMQNGFCDFGLLDSYIGYEGIAALLFRSERADGFDRYKLAILLKKRPMPQSIGLFYFQFY